MIQKMTTDFIQDRNQKGIMPETPDDIHNERYVHVRVYDNGDVEHLNYSDDRKELEKEVNQ